MKIIFGIFLGLVWLGAGNAWGLVDVDLTEESEYLPYLTEEYSHFHVRELKNRGFGPPGLLFDVDDDGYQDFIRSNEYYVTAVGYNLGNPVTYYQTNLPPEFCREEGPSFSLAGPFDLNGDGQEEIVVTGFVEDCSLWRFWTLDPRTGDTLASFDLGRGPEIRADGIWDGYYTVIGALNCSVDGRDRTGLVICVNIGFDLEGRGVLAIDPWTGESLWKFETGPNPLNHSTTVVDLDGDGSREVVIYGRAPDNLGGRKVNGYSDNESRLFVLDNQGELKWTKRLGGWYGGGYLLTEDMTGDGNLEIITSTHTTPEVWGELAVWSHDGHILTRHTEEDQLQDIALLPRSDNGPPSLAVTSTSGLIRVFDFTPQGMDLVARFDVGKHCYITSVADILPPPGAEMVVSAIDGEGWVIGNGFKLLTRFTQDKKAWHQNMLPWSAKIDSDLLMHEGGPGYPLMFTKAPRPPLNLALIGGIGVVVLLVVVGMLFWRRFRTVPAGDPAVLREARLNLLEDLELSNHGAIAPLKCLRRLVWHMNAMISGLGDNESIEVRLRETWTESVENALPHLAGILDRARLAGLAGANVDYADRALANVARLLADLDACGFAVEQFEPIASALTAETAKADDALKDLRKEVAGFFHADLADTVTRVLRANSEAIDEAGVAVQAGYLAQMAAGGDDVFSRVANPEVVCLIDPKELDFVMDNLVGNAVRAMKDSAPRNLSVTWSVGDGMVTVDVRDSGCGIPEENLSRIMETQFSTREGGGDGLPRSRKILRKYGGGLSVIDTAVGHGSTFRLTLPTA